MATTTATPEPATGSSLQELAKRHLWMHFTRMGSYADAEVPIIVKGEGAYVYDEHGNKLPRRPLRPLLLQRRSRPRRARRRRGAPGHRARLHHPVELCPPPGDRARGTDRDADAGRPQPGLLHLRRLRSRRVGDQAVARLPPAHRQPAQDEVHHPRGRLPRHHARGPLGHRDHRPAHGLRAARARREPRAEHQQLPLARGPRPAVGRRRDRGEDPLRGARDGRRGDPRAAAERRRLHHPTGGLLPAGARDLRPPQRPARSPTR